VKYEQGKDVLRSDKAMQDKQTIETAIEGLLGQRTMIDAEINGLRATLVEQTINESQTSTLAEPEYRQDITSGVNIYRPKQDTTSNIPPNDDVSGGVNDGLNETE
jgi:hypothetical protein